MIKYIKKHIIVFAATIITGILFGFMQVYVALLMGEIIDIVTAKNIDAFWDITIKIGIFVVCIMSFYYLYLVFRCLIFKLVLRDIRYDVFKGILSQDYKSYYSVNTAEYISSVSNDINIVDGGYLAPLIWGVQQAFILIFALVAIFKISLTLAICSIAGIAFALIFPALYGRILQKHQVRYSDQLSNFMQASKDYYNGFEVAKSYNILSILFKKFSKDNASLAGVKMQRDKAFSLNEIISTFTSIAFQALIFLVGGYLVIIDSMTIGLLWAVINLSLNLINPLTNIIGAYGNIKGTLPIMAKLTAYANNSVDTTGHPIADFNDEITVKDVCFSYGDNSNFQLHLPKLTIKKGKKYAVIGTSGSGKSTFINLITGREKNYTGEILVDNIPIKDINESALNHLMAINHQDIFMFTATVKENITLFQEYEQPKLETSLIKSGVKKFLSALHGSINSHAGENGNKLSGGQKQRIALARSFIQDKPILILDEGTSAVDMQTGFDIENDLLQDEDLTLITITHRLSSTLLSQYDEIIVLDNGTIKEVGTYEHVISNNDLSDFFKHKN